MTAEAFFKWLRDALAHGDGRTIKPIHKVSIQGDGTLLAGFAIAFRKSRDSNDVLNLHLFHADIRHLGIRLADEFCFALSGGRDYFEREVGTAKIKEAGEAA